MGCEYVSELRMERWKLNGDSRNEKLICSVALNWVTDFHIPEFVPFSGEITIRYWPVTTAPTTTSIRNLKRLHLFKNGIEKREKDSQLSSLEYMNEYIFHISIAMSLFSRHGAQLSTTDKETRARWKGIDFSPFISPIPLPQLLRIPHSDESSVHIWHCIHDTGYLFLHINSRHRQQSRAELATAYHLFLGGG